MSFLSVVRCNSCALCGIGSLRNGGGDGEMGGEREGVEGEGMGVHYSCFRSAAGLFAIIFVSISSVCVCKNDGYRI